MDSNTDIKQQIHSPMVNQQPQSPAPMQSQPGVESKEISRAQNGEWMHSLWDCFTPGELALKSCCCSCFVFGKTMTRLEDPSLQSYSSVNPTCLIYLGLNYLGGWAPLWQMIKRQEMRLAYDIKGNMCYDCMSSCFCHCCVLMQMDKEVVARQAMGPPGGMQQHHQQGYASPGGMQAVPQ